MSCTVPALGRRISELPPGVEPEAPELLEHLRDCQSCAQELTQRLRWFSAWDRAEPSAAAIARLRLKTAATRRSSPRRLTFAYAAAALLATGLASATGYLWQRLDAPTPAPSASAQVSLPASAQDRAVARPAQAPLEAAPSPPPAVASSESREAPKLATPRPVTSAQVAETWSEAATALRQGDTQRANKALDELSRSRDAATRDAARLALAELWMSQQQADKAQPLLRELAAKGATPLIRRRAKELLQ